MRGIKGHPFFPSWGCDIDTLKASLTHLRYCSRGSESEIQPPVPAVYLAVALLHPEFVVTFSHPLQRAMKVSVFP